MKITFNTDHTPAGQGERPTYKAGETYDFPDPVAETYARKYVNRGLAHEYVEPAPVVAAAAEPAVTEEADEGSADDVPEEPADEPSRGRRGRRRW